MLARLLPAVCDVSVTNVCNAACDFCGFARDKTLIGPRRHIDPDAFAKALPILHRRGIRYITLQGGEPLVHPDIVMLVGEVAAAGMQPAIITNGWFVPRDVESLRAAGLKRLIISIDSADLALHEHNRGLDGLGGRIRQGITKALALGLPVSASVTISRLVRYGELPETLRSLGFQNASMLMHAGVVATDVAEARSASGFATAVASLFRRSVVLSLWALIEQAPQIHHLARRGRTRIGSRKPRGNVAERIWARKGPRKLGDRHTGAVP